MLARLTFFDVSTERGGGAGGLAHLPFLGLRDAGGHGGEPHGGGARAVGHRVAALMPLARFGPHLGGVAVPEHVGLVVAPASAGVGVGRPRGEGDQREGQGRCQHGRSAADGLPDLHGQLSRRIPRPADRVGLLPRPRGESDRGSDGSIFRGPGVVPPAVPPGRTIPAAAAGRSADVHRVVRPGKREVPNNIPVASVGAARPAPGTPSHPRNSAWPPRTRRRSLNRERLNSPRRGHRDAATARSPSCRKASPSLRETCAGRPRGRGLRRPARRGGRGAEQVAEQPPYAGGVLHLRSPAGCCPTVSIPSLAVGVR